jgi:S1-C subfamily serine protease
MSMELSRRPQPLMRAAGLLTAAVWLIASVGLLVWWVWPRNATVPGPNPNAEPRAVAARGELSALEQTTIGIYKTAAPSVVHVTNLAKAGGSALNLDVRQVPKGTGSGFVWDQDGHVVTNYHVVEGADAARVTLADHATYEARQVWADPSHDIAVLSIGAPKDKLHPILIGTSHDLQVGQSAYAIGNPFGLDQTMTVGIVSALDREIDAADGRPIRGAIQTSAAINPGNSGGPLLDSAGRLIGMNTAIISPSGASAGIGFAIPVDEINRIVPQLIGHGRVVRPRLGVQVAADQLAQQLGVSEGALVLNVLPNTPAAEAGLQGTRRDAAGRIILGDVIVAVGGQPVKNLKDLYAALDRFKVGDTAALTVVREGQRRDVQVPLKDQQ